MKNSTKDGLLVGGLGLGIVLLNVLWIAVVVAVVVLVVKALI